MNIRLERGLRILVLLQTGTQYDAMKLAEELGVTRRTIFRDIAMLKELGLVIEYDARASSYCVQVPEDEAKKGQGTEPKTRSLNPIELASVLRPALDDDLSKPSSTAIIRQIAMNLAATDTWQSSNPPPATMSLRETPSNSPQRMRSSSRIDRYESLIPAPHISATAKTIYFDRLIDQVSYICDSITNQRTLRIWNRVEQRLSEVRPTELRFAHAVWTVSGMVESGIVHLNLSAIEIVYEFQPS